MSCLGLDIGGANLKAANSTGWARSVPFALWRNPAGLASALGQLIGDAPAAHRLAVTMTGELCDCFRTKEEGVLLILSAVREVANGREVRVYLVDGRWVSLEEAISAPILAAASNWRALAEFACRFVPTGAGLLIDIGSTTTDIIPIESGRVAARGRSDIGRLAAGELVYSGVGRTPICALVRALPWRGQMCPVAAEVFATTADAYLVLGNIREDTTANWTADGRPLTIECARQRLARQLCADAGEFAAEDIERMARCVRECQLRTLTDAIQATAGGVSTSASMAVVGGTGEFLARAAVESARSGWGIQSLAERLGPDASRCGPAFALAMLAEGSR